jgi:hypothetical protein
MFPTLLFRGRLDFFRGFFAVILGGYFFCAAFKIGPSPLELVLDDSYSQVSEPLCESGPERLERCDPEGKYADQEFSGRVIIITYFKK